VGDGKKQDVTRLLKRGLNHYGLGELEAAIASWEKALALDPENCAARDYLETAYEESAETEAKIATSGEDATPRTFDAPGEMDLDLDGEDEPDTLVAEALQAYKSGRLEQAWDTMQQVASRDPERLDVQGYIAMLRSERARSFAREVGDQGRILRLKRTMREIMGLNLTPDEGFLLSQIDGSVSIEQLHNLSNDRVRTLEVIAKFMREGLVE
jgi:tetratricopeptide (TPR) repeat protein